MIIRVQSKNGTKRLHASPSETVATLLTKIAKDFELHNNDNWFVYQNRDRTNELKKGSKSKLSSKKLKHGDMCYLVLTDTPQNAGDCENDGADIRDSVESPVNQIKEDEIDIDLWKQAGQIPQSKGSSSKGVFKTDDLPLNPWDEGYLRSKDIKFMSFHAYMRQKTAGADRGKYFKLENTKTACKLEGTNDKKRLVDTSSIGGFWRFIHRPMCRPLLCNATTEPQIQAL